MIHRVIKVNDPEDKADAHKKKPENPRDARGLQELVTKAAPSLTEPKKRARFFLALAELMLHYVRTESLPKLAGDHGLEGPLECCKEVLKKTDGANSRVVREAFAVWILQQAANHVHQH